jgi:dihydrodipicolinate synthase/N-acetylneuraminate lyase
MFGGVGVTSNNWDAAMCLAMYEAFQKGDYKKCIEIQCGLNASWPLLLVEALAQQAYAAKIFSSNIGMMKLQASLCMDIDMGPPMAPFLPATPEEAQRVKTSLEKIPIKVKPLKR